MTTSSATPPGTKKYGLGVTSPHMRALYIHADSLDFSAKKRTPVAEELEESAMRGGFKEALVAFISVEKSDEERLDAVARQASRDIKDVAAKVGAERVVLYPYAHLSPSLSSPDAGKRMLREMERLLADEGVEVHRAPFGWYKAFTLACKGHPLSELSRELNGEEQAAAPKGEDVHLVLTESGELIEPKDFKDGTECFQVMMMKEALHKESKLSGDPRYLRLCRKFGIQWEGMSDSGHMSFSPKGALMFDLCADYSWRVVNSLGLAVYTVKGTNMFNLDEGPVAEHAKLFGDRLYKVETEKHSFVLRYAACHQQFAMMRNWNMSYKQLPFGAFEVADSYRLEQSGETMLCFRTRRMNMPDLHVVCDGMAPAEEWFSNLDDRIYEEARRVGRDYEMLINFSSREAFESHKPMIMELLKRHGKPALLHFYPEGINYYWTVNIEYHMLDDMKRAREIGTVQIDVGNAGRFGITYTDADGRDAYPVILHCAVIGTIERYMYMLLDTAVQMEAEGRVGHLPVWVNPEQVRLLTVSDAHVARAKELADRLQSQSIRVGIDDRSETVGKKVRQAKQDWCSYVIVVGDSEMAGDVVDVYDRQRNANEKMPLQDLIDRVRSQIADWPFRPMYLPREMSRRVDFVDQA